MIFNTKGSIASASAWLPLLFDTVVLVLTVMKTYSSIKYPTVVRTTRVILQEGVMYYRYVVGEACCHVSSDHTPYSVLFCVSLVLTLMISIAPPGLQNVTAQ